MSGESSMKLLKSTDFLADIQFVDYWDTGFFLKKLKSGVSLNNRKADV